MTAIQTVSRYALAFVVATVVTFAVFFLMQTLIASGEGVLSGDDERFVVDFVRVQQQEQVKEKERQKPEPPKPEKEPPKPQTPQNQAQQQAVSGESLSIGPVAMDTSLNLDAGISGGGSSEYLPIVKVQPNYPRRALRRGIEGYVVVEFTVTRSGTVKDPRVVEADPPELFNSAALEAAKKFKYRPKMINGEATQVAGVRNIIRFQLDKKR
ncbi:outer membrane transport energization protein TonB [Tamilnaduibacter salinus]|uniref:Protein TonB n=1 Tax=Tamilnaduibacter salinus TaxID=1484056 RepID=A0A2U1CY08_9GAMM|nr:energy transducer TonB [Tamilnaduibacter salinus]PVY77363.1 outer membrane transport energization protein TonB [Tamilnaduibacter salinus]